jgi:thioredoxin reductase
MFDVVIVGAGPAGLSACYRAKELGLKYICFERERIANTLLTYPHGKDIQYYPANVEVIGKLPLPKGKAKDTLIAWQRFARSEKLNIREEDVTDIKKDGTFRVTTNKGGYESKFVLLAIGVQGTIRKVPIECDTPGRVCYSLKDPGECKGMKALVVGGGDTAVEHALLMRKAGADVTISYRKPSFFRLKEANQKALDASGISIIFNSNVLKAGCHGVVLEIAEEGKPGETRTLPAEKVFVFAGTIPATDFMTKIGLKLENNKPVYNGKYESNIPGLFIAGDLTKEPLIKPAINHGVKIVDEIKSRLV